MTLTGRTAFFRSSRHGESPGFPGLVGDDGWAAVDGTTSFGSWANAPRAAHNDTRSIDDEISAGFSLGSFGRRFDPRPGRRPGFRRPRIQRWIEWRIQRWIKWWRPREEAPWRRIQRRGLLREAPR